MGFGVTGGGLTCDGPTIMRRERTRARGERGAWFGTANGDDGQMKELGDVFGRKLITLVSGPLDERGEEGARQQE